MKKAIYLLLLSLLLLSGAFAETITKVGIVDMVKIMDNYYKESSSWSAINQITDDIIAEEDKVTKEILELDEERLEAQDSGDRVREIQLEDQISQKEYYIKEYVRVKNQQRTRKIKDFENNSPLYDEIRAAVQRIAEKEGYSIILHKRDTDLNIVWWSQDIDITDEVLTILLR